MRTFLRNAGAKSDHFKFMLLVFLLGCSYITQVWAQSRQVSGVVLDSKTKESIIGASVYVVGTTSGVQTDLDGKFTLTVDAKSRLKISYIGYTEQIIAASSFGNQPLQILLVEASSVLDEVVVTAYGGRQLRTKLTNSIAKVDKEVLKQGMFANPAQALSGAIAGLRVAQTSGDPGATPSIVLRGGTDFNGGGSPLILVDGQVRPSMSDINPSDIESMEVLKDAGATAIYGARANNGVILITTKRGRSGHSEITFSSKLGMNYFHSGYDFLNARDYIHWMRTAYVNGNTAAWTDARGNKLTHPDGSAIKSLANINALDQAQPFGTGNKYFDKDGKTPLDGNVANNAIWSPMEYSDELAFLLNQGWQRMDDPAGRAKNGIIFTENRLQDFNLQSPALSQDYNLSMRGGNDRGSYYSGLGYNHSKGSVYGNWYQRMSFIINADYKIKPWLKSESSFNFTDAKWYGLSDKTNVVNYFSRGFSVPPTFRGYNAKGEQLLGVNSGDGNQRFNHDKFIRDNNTTKFTLNQAFTINFLKDLSLKLNGIWYYSDGKYESFDKDYLDKPNVWNKARNSSASFERTLDQTYNAVLNYRTQIQEHSLDAMAGFEFYDSYTKGFSASGSGAPTDDFMDLGLTLSEKDKRGIDSWHIRSRIMSFFGRLNYDYKSKYLLSLVVRRDGYSRLAKENRWGTFPGMSAGWVFSKEDFMQSYKDILSFGKLRMSFGLNGNVNPSHVKPYTVQGAYSALKYNGQVGFLLSELPNPYLEWEKSRTFEIGADLGFLNNRINANITYYDRLTIDKFADITIPSVSGINTSKSNNGEFLNRGLEFELAFRIIDTKDFKWRLGWNGAYNRSTIIKLPDNKKIRNQQNAFEVYSGKDQTDKIWVGGYQEGQTPGDLYTYEALGIYQSEDKIPAGLIDISGRSPLYGGKEGYDKLDPAQKKNSLPIRPGDIRWRDVNGDGKIDQFDKVKVGNNTPKWTGGFNTSFSWKGLTLSARFDYALGFTIIDTKTPWIMGAAQGTFNTIKESQDTWSVNNRDAKYPQAVWADFLGKDNYRTSTLFTYRGDYLSFREVTLSYQLPKAWIKKLQLENLELSVTGQNLGYWTQSKHIFSPEQGGSNNGGYPLPRIVIFGANLTL